MKLRSPIQPVVASRSLIEQARLLLWIMAVLAMATRALIANGYMPDRRQDGRFVITWCTGHGPATSIVDLGWSGQRPDPTRHGNKSAASDCPYGLSPIGLGVTTTPVLADESLLAPLDPASPHPPGVHSPVRFALSAPPTGPPHTRTLPT